MIRSVDSGKEAIRRSDIPRLPDYRDWLLVIDKDQLANSIYSVLIDRMVFRKAAINQI